MSALLELIKEAPPEDRKAAAEMLKPYMSFEKEEPEEDWEPLDKLRSSTPGPKSKAWIQTFILNAYPETRKWSTDPNPGKGRAVWINLPVAKKWVHDHTAENRLESEVSIVDSLIFAWPALVITVTLLGAVVGSLVHDHRKGVNK